MKNRKKSPIKRSQRSRYSTPTGDSISEIALKLKQQNPALPYGDAKDQAKNLLKARETLKYGTGGALKYKILTHVFGEVAGRQIAKVMTSKKQEEEAAELLTNVKTVERKTERIPDKDVRMILKRLDKIDAEIKSLRIVKVKAPDTTGVKAERSDAHAVLEKLGYKKNEIPNMLEGAPENAGTEELVKHALTPTAQRLKPNEVKSEVSSTRNSILSERKDPSVVESTSNKEDALKVVSETKHADEVKKEEKWEKKVLALLDDIEEKVDGFSKNPIWTTISAVWSVLKTMWDAVKPIIAPILRYLKNFITGISAVEAAAAAGAAAITAGGLYAIDHDVRQNVDKTIDKIVTDDRKKGVGSKDWQINLKNDLDAAMKSSSAAYTKQNLLARLDPKDKTFSDEEKKFLRNYFKVSEPEIEPVAKTEVVAPNNTPQQVASTKIENASAERKSMESEERVDSAASIVTVVQQQTPQPAPQPRQTFAPVVLRVRNDEPSQAAYVGSLFNHPVTKSGTSRI